MLIFKFGNVDANKSLSMAANHYDTNHMGFDPVCDSGLSVCLSGLGLGKS